MTPVSRMSSPPNGRMAQRRESHRRPSTMMPEGLANCVDEWPLTSLCAAFGGGLIAGVGLVALYCQMQHSQTMTESLMHRVSDTVRNAMPSQAAAESLVQRVSDTVRNSLSQSLSAFHS